MWFTSFGAYGYAVVPRNLALDAYPCMELRVADGEDGCALFPLRAELAIIELHFLRCRVLHPFDDEWMVP